MGAVFGKMTNVAAPLPSLHCVQPEEFVAIAQDSNGSEASPRWQPFTPSYTYPFPTSLMTTFHYYPLLLKSSICFFVHPTLPTYLPTYLSRSLPPSNPPSRDSSTIPRERPHRSSATDPNDTCHHGSIHCLLSDSERRTMF